MKTQTVTILLGLPGSGKTTLAKTLINENTLRINKDSLREMLSNGVYTPEIESVLKVTWEAAIRNALFTGFNVIIDDAGNLNWKTQQKIIDIVRDVNRTNHTALQADEKQDIEIVFNKSCLKTPIEECIRRDALRDKPVGETVIREMEERYKFQTLE